MLFNDNILCADPVLPYCHCSFHSLFTGRPSPSGWSHLIHQKRVKGLDVGGGSGGLPSINDACLNPLGLYILQHTHAHRHKHINIYIYTYTLIYSWFSSRCLSGVKIKEQLQATLPVIDWRWSQCDGEPLLGDRKKQGEERKREGMRGNQGKRGNEYREERTKEEGRM